MKSTTVDKHQGITLYLPLLASSFAALGFPEPDVEVLNLSVYGNWHTINLGFEFFSSNSRVSPQINTF